MAEKGKSTVQLILEAIDKNATKVITAVDTAQKKAIQTQKQSTQAEAKAKLESEKLAQAKARTAAATNRAAAAANRAAISTARKAQADRKAAADAKKNEEANIKLAGGFMQLAIRAGSAAAAYFTFKSAFSVTKDLTEAVKIMDRISNGLELIAGSAEAAGEEYGFVRSEAKRLGIQLKTTASEYTKLLAAGESTGFSMAEVRDIFEATNEAAVAMSLSNEDLHGTLRAIQQMMSKGSVQAEELRGQLGERLPGAFGLAARALGVTTKELAKMLETGDVAAKDLLPLLALEMKKTFGDQAQKASADYAREIDRVETAIFELQEQAGRPVTDELAEWARGLSETLEELNKSGRLEEFALGLATIFKTIRSGSGALDNAVKEFGLLTLARLEDSIPEDSPGASILKSFLSKTGAELQEEVEALEHFSENREKLLKQAKEALGTTTRIVPHTITEGGDQTALQKFFSGDRPRRTKTVYETVIEGPDPALVQERAMEMAREAIKLEKKQAEEAAAKRNAEIEAEQEKIRAQQKLDKIAEGIRKAQAKHEEEMAKLRISALDDAEQLVALQNELVRLQALQKNPSLSAREVVDAKQRELEIERELFKLRAKKEKKNLKPAGGTFLEQIREGGRNAIEGIKGDGETKKIIDVVDLAENAWETLFKNLETGWKRSFDMLLGDTEYWSQKLGYVAGPIIGSMTAAIGAFFAEWIAKRLVLDRLETVLGVKKTAATVAQGQVALAANTPAAAAASIGSFGAAVPIGIAAMTAALGAFSTLPNFADGVVDFKGKGGPRSDSNLVRISNTESVITGRGTALNKPYLQYANDGGRISDLVDRSGGKDKIYVVDSWAAARALQSQIPTRAEMIDVANQQIQKHRA